RALGRKIMWGEKISARKSGKANDLQFVRRLRVYPHALRQANAYYDPNRKALLFGYFQASPANAQLQLPGSTVFTCLSHDIIAHETTHAILDGLHRRYIDATHPDTRAFHEAFADIVALFQHFTFPEVLRHQIAATQGDLNRQNLLGQLAQEFGRAIGGYGSLRDAIGHVENGEWTPHLPNPDDYVTQMEPHRRGAILVGAVFDVFLSIYRSRVRKLLRIATGGSGILPAGDLYPDLVDEMAGRAAATAGDILRICIRALDYCPPMDITFGDYLRALLTADADMVPDDPKGYRVAFVEAFQKRGIRVSGVRSMAVEELIHPLNPGRQNTELAERVGLFLRELSHHVGYLSKRSDIDASTKEFIRDASGLHTLIQKHFAADTAVSEQLSGMRFSSDPQKAERLGFEFGYLMQAAAANVISNVWLANRVTPQGRIVNHVIVTLVQKRGVRFHVSDDGITVDETGYFVPDKTAEKDRGEHSIIFRGGCTLVFDLDTLQLRYAIQKDIDDHDRMILQYKFQRGLLDDDGQAYFDRRSMTTMAGPFAFMHSHSAHH
ncbi:MAG: hypothetical protein KDA96_20930, partial [Planctomycetaceae bacterium]|nr:hypothetical protein [Planctomycetaceae bacterium]